MHNNGGRLSKRSAVKKKGEYNDWRHFEIPSICDSRRTFFSCLMLSCFLFFIFLLSPLPPLSLFPLIPLPLPFSPLSPLSPYLPPPPSLSLSTFSSSISLSPSPPFPSSLSPSHPLSPLYTFLSVFPSNSLNTTKNSSVTHYRLYQSWNFYPFPTTLILQISSIWRTADKSCEI